MNASRPKQNVRTSINRQLRCVCAAGVLLLLAGAWTGCSDDSKTCPPCSKDSAAHDGPLRDALITDHAAADTAPKPDTRVPADNRLKSFVETLAALKAGYTVRASFDYARCTRVIGTKSDPGPNARATTDVTNFEYSPKQTGVDKGRIRFGEAHFALQDPTYFQNLVRIDLLEDNTVDAHVQFVDPVTLASSLDEHFLCDIDVDGKPTKTNGLSLYRVRETPRALYSFGELLDAVDAGERTRALIDLSKCKVAGQTTSGPNQLFSIDLDVYEYFGKFALSNLQAYISASHSTLTFGSGDSHPLQYVRIKPDETNAVPFDRRMVDSKTNTEISKETYSCAFATSTTDTTGAVTAFAR